MSNPRMFTFDVQNETAKKAQDRLANTLKRHFSSVSSSVDIGNSILRPSESQSSWYSLFCCCFQGVTQPEPQQPLVDNSRISSVSIRVSETTIQDISYIAAIMEAEYASAKTGTVSLFLGGTFGQASQAAYTSAKAGGIWHRLTNSLTKAALTVSGDKRADQKKLIANWISELSNDYTNRTKIYEQLARFIQENGSFISGKQGDNHSPINYLLVGLLFSPLREQIYDLIENQLSGPQVVRRTPVQSGMNDIKNVFFVRGIYQRQVFNHGISYQKITNTLEKELVLAEGLTVYDELTEDLVLNGYYIVIPDERYIVVKKNHTSNGECSLLFIDGVDPELQKLHRDSIFAYIPGVINGYGNKNAIPNPDFCRETPELKQRRENREQAVMTVQKNNLESRVSSIDVSIS